MAARANPIIGVGEHYLTEYELAKRWRVPVSFLRRRRTLGLPPAYLKLGMHVRYDLESIERFERDNRRAASGEI